MAAIRAHGERDTGARERTGGVKTENHHHHTAAAPSVQVQLLEALHGRVPAV